MQKKMLFHKEIVIPMRLNYLLYLPEGYYDQAKQKWPLVLFLHGAGEIGNNLELLRVQGLPKVLEKNRSYPFIAVSPQCPTDSCWHEEFDVLDQLLLYLMDEYHVDQSRIYLTGLSMGGFAAWDYPVLRPELFAAVIPICGGSSYLKHLDLIQHIPFWVFHGAKDDIVPLQESKEAVAALKKAGGDVMLTVYEDEGHDSWSMTYDNPEVYQWLLSKSKEVRNLQPIK